MGRKDKKEKSASSSRDTIAAGFGYVSRRGVTSVWLPGRGTTLIDKQKFRNNWYVLGRRELIGAIRPTAEINWFLGPVLSLKQAVITSGFDVEDEDLRNSYAFGDLVDDIANELLVASSVVCIWRRGQSNPPVTVLDGELVEYCSVGGVEQICLHFDRVAAMSDPKHKGNYERQLGGNMYEAMAKGKKLVVTKSDSDWAFEVLFQGKRRGELPKPQLTSVMDALDYVELLKIGDWNLANFRKDVIRMLKKGYEGKGGPGGMPNTVNITKTQVKDLGEGFSKIDGGANVPMNHDVNPGYLLVPSENFDPKVHESAIRTLLLWGGIEAVALLGNFSQQNGAAPSLMRNSRAGVLWTRGKVEKLLSRIFSANEFKSLPNIGKGIKVKWSVKPLYSIEELKSLHDTLDGGTASPQTLREMWDLDDDVESERMRDAHSRKADFIPPFEKKQGLVGAYFPSEFTMTTNTSTTNGDPGRPSNPSPA